MLRAAERKFSSLRAQRGLPEPQPHSARRRGSKLNVRAQGLPGGVGVLVKKCAQAKTSNVGATPESQEREEEAERSGKTNKRG